ncbi:hypothetical protein [Jannaschia sp. 2305UL9-9]|uniref:hypothetical protein n=1 Tax=Jannaschia sp. 2305UL9-9 TaxID=3121638 RepID=UPI003526EAAB
MLNAISDADMELGSLSSLASHLSAHPQTRVINAPDAVMETTRDGNYNRLLDLPNVHFPGTIRVVLDAPTPKDLDRQLRALDFRLPVILRRTGTQTGRSTVRIDAPEDLVTFCADEPRGEFYAIQYKQLLWRDTFFRKMRLFCIDGAAYPVVCHFDHVWNVHGGNRRTVMKASAELMEQEQHFLRDWRGYIGSKAAAAVEDVFARTPLDFFGMDFTVDTDGGLFIYELNASMRHSFDHARNFPYKQPHDQATSDAFEAMVHRRFQA